MDGVASACNQESRRQTERHRKAVDIRPITPYVEKHYPANDPLRVTGPENSGLAGGAEIVPAAGGCTT